MFPAVPVPASSSGSSAPVDPYLALSTQIREHHEMISAEMTAHRQQIFAEMTAYYQRMEQRLDNDLSYICDFMRYLDAYLSDIYQKYDWPVPLPSDRARPLPSTGPPFPVRTLSVPPPPSTTQRDPDSDSDEQ